MATALGTRPLAASADPLAPFKRWLTIAVAIDALFGVVAIIWPRWLTEFLHFGAAYPTIWVRMVGLYAILFAVTYVPAMIVPIANPFLAVWAFVARFIFVIFFFIAALNVASGFWIVVIYDLAIGFVLGRTYWRGFRDDLMSRP